MATHANPGSFCLRSPSPLSQPHPEPLPTPIQNAWPSLAQPDDLDYVRTNPLIRLYFAPGGYGPIERPQRVRRGTSWVHRGGSDFLTWLLHLHEVGHLYYLEWTPAKELAKVYLAYWYAEIAQLFFSDSPTDRQIVSCLNGLWHWTESLAEIEMAIRFAEEVIVTGMSLKAIEVATQPGKMWEGCEEELSQARRRFLAQRDLREACRRTAPLIDWLYGRPERSALVVPLLQPIHVSLVAQRLGVVDAYERLENVLDILHSTPTDDHTERQLRAWATAEEMEWRISLGIQFLRMQGPADENDTWLGYAGAFSRMLWDVTRTGLKGVPSDAGERSMAAALRDAAAAQRAIHDEIAAGRRLGPDGVILLRPRVYRGRSIIDPGWLTSHQGPGATDLVDTHIILLYFEGLRQQIFERTGFICPNNPRGTRCRCSKRVRQAMKRFVDLARGGAFGDGTWTPLPCHP